NAEYKTPDIFINRPAYYGTSTQDVQIVTDNSPAKMNSQGRCLAIAGRINDIRGFELRLL
ncbi:MAG: hypothetical protein J6A39_01895, partial [Peptococcaceae bacterium]|nr:hypothetical protein [Peptococcaceae bacterium]